ncbi:hypothetical protein CBA19CS11_02820 [Caballeronia novacaledonica]|uniref:hypothetical protein n=1 Tax=Caballeronia novacaledonica TaxID=1544861 RepID=UPI001EE2267C|nr:hypothetical protein [Caballeronia novacaledonica]GJH07724.1 hypothetical protein CBA19CS11_02820 [Caballeronia novacaledonica]
MMGRGFDENPDCVVSMRHLEGAVIIKSWNRHVEEAMRRAKTIRKGAIPHDDKKQIRKHVERNLKRVADADARSGARDPLTNPDYIVGDRGTIVERNPSDPTDTRDTGIFPEELPAHVQESLRNARFILDADLLGYGDLLLPMLGPILQTDPSGRLWAVVCSKFKELKSELSTTSPLNRRASEVSRTSVNFFRDANFAVTLSVIAHPEGSGQIEARIEFT